MIGSTRAKFSKSMLDPATPAARQRFAQRSGDRILSRFGRVTLLGLDPDRGLLRAPLPDEVLRRIDADAGVPARRRGSHAP